jgi:hypothetical protein
MAKIHLGKSFFFTGKTRTGKSSFGQKFFFAGKPEKNARWQKIFFRWQNAGKSKFGHFFAGICSFGQKFFFAGTPEKRALAKVYLDKRFFFSGTPEKRSPNYLVIFSR